MKKRCLFSLSFGGARACSLHELSPGEGHLSWLQLHGGSQGQSNGSGQASIYISNQRKAEWGPVQALSNNPPARTTEEAQENHLLRVHPQWPHLLKLPQHFPTPTLSGWSCQSQWLLGDTQTSANHSTCGWWLEDSNSVVRGWNMWFCFSNKVPQDAADPWTTLWVAMA